MATLHPSPTAPSTWASGTNTSSKKISAKPVSPSIWGMGRTVTPGAGQLDEEVGQSPVPLGFRIGAEQPEAPVGEGAAGGPRLLADEQPPTSSPGPHGPAADAGQVAAGVGLGPPLAPDLRARGHGRQEALLLGRRPELEQGRGQEEHAVLADPQGGPGPPVLLLEDEPLEDADPPSAVVLRPRHDRPPIVGHGRFPVAVGLEALGRVQ